MRSTLGKSALIAVLLLIVILMACPSVWWMPVEGVIVEEGTGKPVAGAFVATKWIQHGTSGFVGSRSSCVWLEVVRADDEGRFRIPGAVILALWSVDRTSVVYKAGLQNTHANPGDPRRFVMRPFLGTPTERAKELQRYDSLKACQPDADVTRRLLPLFEALDREDASLQAPGAPKPERGPFVETLMSIEEGRQMEQRQRQREQKR